MSDDLKNSAQPSTDPLIGCRWENRFEIEEVLGKGAASTVYRAKQILLDRDVALKILHSSLKDSKQQDRFQKEASMLSTFEHPNIVRLLGYGQSTGGQDYMVLEYVEGQTLQKILEKEGTLSLEECMPIFQDLLSGLAYAHENGIVHRDIKPANIIVSESQNESCARLLDFGIFKDLNKQALPETRTPSQNKLGTANYMSPEQCLGEELDQKSDIYSLACVFYESLVGQPPMDDASDLAIMSKQLNKQIRSIPARQTIPRKLEKLLLKALSKNISDRPSSAEFSEALKVITADPGELTAQAKGSNRAVLLISALLLCLLCFAYYQMHLNKHPHSGQDGYLVRQRYKRPPAVTTSPAAVELLRQWIEANAVIPKPNLADLSTSLLQVQEMSSVLHQPICPQAERIEKLVLEEVRRRQKSASEFNKAQAEARGWLVRVYMARGKNSEALSSLKILKQRAADETDDHYRMRLLSISSDTCKLDPTRANLLEYLSLLEGEEKMPESLNLKNKFRCLLSQSDIYYKLYDLKTAEQKARQAFLILKEISKAGQAYLQDEELKALTFQFLSRYPALGIDLAENTGQVLRQMIKDRPSLETMEYYLRLIDTQIAANKLEEAKRGLSFLEEFKSKELSNELSKEIFLRRIMLLSKGNKGAEIDKAYSSLISSSKAKGQKEYVEAMELMSNTISVSRVHSNCFLNEFESFIENKSDTYPEQRAALFIRYGHFFRDKQELSKSERSYNKGRYFLNKVSDSNPNKINLIFSLGLGMTHNYLDQRRIKEARESLLETAQYKERFNTEEKLTFDCLKLQLDEIQESNPNFSQEALELCKQCRKAESLNLASALWFYVRDSARRRKETEALALINSFSKQMEKQGLSNETDSILSYLEDHCKEHNDLRNLQKCKELRQSLKSKKEH